MASTPLTLPPQSLRIPLGRPLTFPEGDNNFSNLASFVNELAQQFAAIVNQSGQIVAPLGDRVVQARNIVLNFMPYAVDTGSAANTYAIAFDPALTAYVDGLIVFVLASHTSSATSTLNINGLGPIGLLKNSANLVQGDIVAGEVFVATYYGGVFHLLLGGGGGGASNVINLETYAPAPVTLPLSQTPAINTINFTHGLGTLPLQWGTFLVCTVAEFGFNVGDVVPLSDFVTTATTPNREAFTTSINASTLNVTQNITPPMIARVSDGGAGHGIGTVEPINPAHWNLLVNAARVVLFDASGGLGFLLANYNQYGPIALPIPSSGAVQTFAHGLSSLPQYYGVVMRCTSTELGFAVDDTVPLENFLGVDFDYAFTVTINATNVLVQRNIANIYVRKRSATIGDLTQIDTTKWELQVIAWNTTNAGLLSDYTYGGTQILLSASGQQINEAHNLGGLPEWVRLTASCVSADAGYAVGDELDASCFFCQISPSNVFRPFFFFGANTTNVFAGMSTGTITSVQVLQKTTGAATAITRSKWQLNMYARKYNVA